ncbi:heparan-alpha-glucosaminide N-acetyltransferase domain-containing protein [Neotamlana sedimentorum]|uniref:heparan-alpha-glucosaminide N-acetyltransferase domain-containing protein n=1 Tax=Neotamlana sedimentorum TaxID=1435349 RepID=UPI00069A1D79|nr:heparan-alpha-glucosaminide N-acetyltransferase domain-containing protein [Tamlana sedimentorum]
MQTTRLYFIDAVRAFAIIMMLQGHFIDTLLNPIYRNANNIYYNTWSYFRGITAPVFFTISGLVFAYLLLLAYQKGDDKPRIKKGLFRGLLLIVIGYSLRINVLNWLSGNFNSYVLVIDVLQCIGLSLIILVLLHILFKRFQLIYAFVLLLLGISIFVTEPLYRTLELNNVPLIFSNYLSKSNGSVFTMLPWFGYTAFGAFLSVIFFNYAHKRKFKTIATIAFFIIGFALIYLSTFVLLKVSYFTGIEIFKRSANYNYLFTRLGDVFILFGLLYTLEKYLKQSLITNIGKKTLSIYVIHFIILYGSFTGYGLKRYLYKSLDPVEVVCGALIFIVCVCFIAFYYVRTNTFIYTLIRKLVDKLKG